ncbi:PREDICTED: uncharacterized protein LOC109581489 isoform X16 [Amphimedon queenslandica]|uniref:HTH CENPB-type domain-containing protein n=1 Tax=Amphimedon queenslandica TaxID=400682 RepID=A0AAN0J399_AMPQE|nr:PREDICTED: uncharacterized protein LOC109581489 isoform X16 [Amphimedon queenslandica]|eukprot:XP_019851197.1 PREDICTED: uncharacterized protein LOC109581489 isoform X16 [Amphimedon queenslandica]
MFPHPPLVKRIVRSKVQAQHSPCLDDSVLLGQPRRSYRKWNDKSMQKAAKAVEEGTMSLRMASEKYSVPKSTLHDRVTGKTDFEARPGPSPYLSFEEEEELASFLIKTAKIGYPRTKRQVLALVERIVSARGICTSVTNGWWERFCKRHPQMTLKMAMPLSYVRAAATDPVILNKYFDTLEETLTDNDILNRPVHIFNCDETGMPLNPKCLKIVDKKGSKNPSYITSNTKAQVTVHACTCAAGYAIPPFVIFKRKSLNPELTKNEVPGTLYGLSENGWMTKDLFYYWFREHFLLYAPQVRPLLLLMDGHATHYSPETIRLAASHKVIIFVLPPNTTHITQALDKGCFGPLKVAWRHLCHEFFVDNPEKATLSLYDFSGIFSEAWARAFSVKNIQSSFKVTGICPLNKSVLEKYVSITEPDSEEKFSVFQPANLARKNGIKHLPLYSPSRSCCHDVSKSAHSELDESLDGFEKHLLERSSRSFKESSVAPSHDSSKISRFLIPPVSPRKSQVDEKALCKVLTSQDSIRLMKDKEEKKQHEARLKEMRKQDRLRKQKVQQSKASGVKVSFAKNQVILEDSDGFQSEVESDCELNVQSDFELDCSYAEWRGKESQSDYESEPSTKTGTRGQKKKLVDIQPQSDYESEPSTETGTRGRKKKLVDIQPQSNYESEPSTKTGRGRKKKLVDIQPQSDYESEPSTKTGTRGRNKKLVDIQPQSDYESEPSTKTGRGQKKKLVDIQPQSDYESEPSTKTGARGRKKKLVDIQPQSDYESEPSTKTGRGRKKKLVDIQPQSDYESEPSTKTRGRKKKLVDIQPQSDYESEPSTKTRGRKKKLVDIQPQSDDESEPSTKTGRRGRKKKLVDIQPQSDDESEPSTKTGTRGQKKKLVDIHPQSDYESVPSTKTGIGIRGRKKKPLDIQPQSDYESEQYTRARDDYVELSDCESINQSIGGTKGSSRSACSSLKDKEDAYLDQWWIKDLKLYNADKESLKSTVPLTDNIINAAQVLLKLQYPHISGWQDTLLEKKMNFDVISSYPAIQLLFVGKNHWICTCAMTPGTVTVMDSLQLYSRLRKATVNLISHVYRYHTFLKSLKIETLAVQQQEGYTDCALFSIAYAVELCLGNNPENSCFDQGQLRNHLYKCFVNKSLIPFPKQKVEPLPRPRRLYYEVKIFCYCRLPENYDKMMIMCDLCQEWYHCSCAGIKESELDDIDDWMCDICNKY